MASPSTNDTDRSLLLEIVLVLALLVGSLLLYWRPAAEGPLAPRWWHWVALGLLFFAIVAVHTWRARRRSHRVLHQVIREEESA